MSNDPFGCSPERVVYYPAQASSSVPFFGCLFGVAFCIALLIVGSFVGVILCPIFVLAAMANNDSGAVGRYLGYWMISIVVSSLCVWAVIASENSNRAASESYLRQTYIQQQTIPQRQIPRLKPIVPLPQRRATQAEPIGTGQPQTNPEREEVFSPRSLDPPEKLSDEANQTTESDGTIIRELKVEELPEAMQQSPDSDGVITGELK